MPLTSVAPALTLSSPALHHGPSPFLYDGRVVAVLAKRFAER
jgi:hypothetical protein